MIIDRLLAAIKPGRIVSIQVGMTRTAVVAETDEGIKCGLAATFMDSYTNYHERPAVSRAGQLLDVPARELAEMINSDSLTESTIGLAVINALLPGGLEHAFALNGHDYLVQHGLDQNIALIGHFPFIDLLLPVAKNVWTFELNPRPGDLPAEKAPEYFPKADIIAITATTIINKTFDELIPLCRPDATVIMLGPSTPLSPILFDLGVQVISGTRVLDINAAILGIAQASSMHQLRERGIVEFITAESNS